MNYAYIEFFQWSDHSSHFALQFAFIHSYTDDGGCHTPAPFAIIEQFEVRYLSQGHRKVWTGKAGK